VQLDIGSVIAGKYQLVRLLGRGAMGEVWLATHDTLGGDFAVKLVATSDDIEADTASGRFQMEAQIAAKLSRKTRHIVSVSDHGEENGVAYLVMEALEGESLDTRIKREGRLSLAETAAIVMQICRALTLAHDEGIFHRDLKPANIFLTKDEDGHLLVKLLDFGIARARTPFKTRSPFMTSKDMVLGTPSYMSPEQARGLDSLDHRCDLWALSTCAFEALATRIPFDGKTVEDIFLSICTFRVVPLSSLRPDLPPAAEAFFTKAFASEIDARFRSAEELSQAFVSLVLPEDLEPFIGVSSSRRLPAAPTAPVAPIAPVAPAAKPSPATAEAPLVSPNTAAREETGRGADVIEPPTQKHGPPAVRVDTGSMAAAGLPTRRSGFVAGGLVALLALAGVAIVAMRTSSSSASAAEAVTTTDPRPPTTTAAPPSMDPPDAPDPVVPAATEESTASPTASSASAKKDRTKAGTGVAKSAPAAQIAPSVTRPSSGSAPAAAPSPTAAPAPTAPTAPTGATAAPAKKGPHDKAEVF
jgi:serine/threonine-protein kinase